MYKEWYFWENVNAGVPQGSILGPLLFLIYINNLPDGLNIVAKLFADDTSIFSTISNITKSVNELNKDLCLINEWAFQWKMSFNPDPNKQAADVIFTRERIQGNHPELVFNKSIVTSLDFQKTPWIDSRYEN